MKYTQKSWQVYSLAVTYYKMNQWKSANIKHFVMTYLIGIWYKRTVVKNIQNTISILIIVAAVSKLVIFTIKLKEKSFAFKLLEATSWHYFTYIVH